VTAKTLQDAGITYNPVTGEFSPCAVTRRHGGKPAAYVRVPAGATYYWMRADSLAWLVMTGERRLGPVPRLDHDPSNLRWDNLCTRGNREPKSGAHGVYRIPGSKRDSYRVTLHVPKGKFQTSSVARMLYVGCWPTLEAAKAAYIEGNELLAKHLARPQLDGSPESFEIIRRSIRDTLEFNHAKR
jgi:hypothetical protein